jgi:regulator of CtrA degradation
MAAFATTAFFDKTYDEAMALARDAQQYFVDVVSNPHPVSEPIEAGAVLRATVAGMRLVARVTHIVAWLMEQKAIGDGAISALAVAQRNAPLLDILVCLKDDDPDGHFPPRLLTLLDRSRRLYTRVARLDEMMRETVH